MACSACSSSDAPNESSPSSGGGAALDSPAGTVACSSDTPIDSYAASLKKAGQAGVFDFELVSSSPAPPALNDNTFIVRVTGKDGAPLNGQLGATLFMPQHGHSSPDVPVVTFDATSGAFTLDPMNLFMVGLWRITFTFQSGADALGAGGAADGADASDGAAASDSAVFQFCVD